MSACKLSVIVVCLNSGMVREACLSALTDQARADGVEILAVGKWGSEDPCDLEGVHSQSKDKFPGVFWLTVSQDATVPQMRTFGLLKSRGDIVGLLEDDCVVGEDWCTAVLRAHESPEAAIGGALLPGGYRSLIDWAVFFCEYARFMPPFSGIKKALPGNHVTYKRSALPALRPEEGFYEIFLHDEWLASGRKLIADPALVARNANHWSVRHITRVPFHHGRAFAGMRSSGFPAWRKGLYAVLSTILPLLKATRLAVEVGNRRRYVVEFCLSLPWIMIFLVGWSLGELVGYAAGPGHSVEEWR